MNSYFTTSFIPQYPSDIAYAGNNSYHGTAVSCCNYAICPSRFPEYIAYPNSAVAASSNGIVSDCHNANGGLCSGNLRPPCFPQYDQDDNAYHIQAHQHTSEHVLGPDGDVIGSHVDASMHTEQRNCSRSNQHGYMRNEDLPISHHLTSNHGSECGSPPFMDLTMKGYRSNLHIGCQQTGQQVDHFRHVTDKNNEYLHTRVERSHGNCNSLPSYFSPRHHLHGIGFETSTSRGGGIENSCPRINGAPGAYSVNDSPLATFDRRHVCSPIEIWNAPPDSLTHPQHHQSNCNLKEFLHHTHHPNHHPQSLTSCGTYVKVTNNHNNSRNGNSIERDESCVKNNNFLIKLSQEISSPSSPVPRVGSVANPSDSPRKHSVSDDPLSACSLSPTNVHVDDIKCAPASPDCQSQPAPFYPWMGIVGKCVRLIQNICILYYTK